MVWKSERWQSRVDAVDSEAACNERRVGSKPCEGGASLDDPQTLEITYCRGEGAAPHTEYVFEDLEDQQQPRLLVSLGSVTALKELCEHEHARYDKVVATLTKCRSAYYKELRWLREQLHLAYQTDEQAQIRRASLSLDDFEVYWFEPEHYIDPETKEFLLKCIRETNRQLILENQELRYKLQQQSVLLEGDCVPAVLRQLRKGHQVSKILRELRGQLLDNAQITEFEDTVCELVDRAVVSSQGGGALTAAVEEERDALKKKLDESEELVRQLREQLASGIDCKLERERANAERERADLVQKRAERLEIQHRALQKEIRQSSVDIGERTLRVQRSLSKLNGALTCLSPAGSAVCTPHVSPSRQRALSVEDVTEATFDEALGHLDDVATGFEAVAQEVLMELHELRSRLATLERQREEQQSSLSEGQAAAERRATEAEAGKAAAIARSKALEAQLEEARTKLGEEQARSAKLRKELAETHNTIETMGMKLVRFKAKIDKLKAELRALQGLCNQELLESDDEDDFDLADFMVPYRKRAAVASGKARWELLSEDAACARKRREHLTNQKYGFTDSHLDKSAPAKQEEISAAFRFLSAPVQTLIQGRPGAMHALRQLHMHLQPHAGRRSSMPSLPHHHLGATTTGILDVQQPAQSTRAAAPLALTAPTRVGSSRPGSGPPPSASETVGSSYGASAGSAGEETRARLALSDAKPPSDRLSSALEVTLRTPPRGLDGTLTVAPRSSSAPSAGGSPAVAVASQSAAEHAQVRHTSAPSVRSTDAKLTTSGALPLKSALSGKLVGFAREAGTSLAAPLHTSTASSSSRPYAAESSIVERRPASNILEKGQSTLTAPVSDTLHRDNPMAKDMRSSPTLRSAASSAVKAQLTSGSARWYSSPESLPASWSRRTGPELSGQERARSPMPSGTVTGLTTGRGGNWLGAGFQRSSMPLTNAGHGLRQQQQQQQQSRSAADLHRLGGAAAAAEGFLPTGLPALPAKMRKPARNSSLPPSSWTVP